MGKGLFATSAVLLALSQGALAQTVPAGVEWDTRLYNPAPLADDVILPMPCGGAMAFRQVLTPNADGVIGDVPVILGQQGTDQPFLDGLRRSYVSGAFPAADGTTRGQFLLAKYELTEAQVDVLRAPSPSSCPQRMGRRKALPQVGLSKTQLDQLAEDYTLWLMNAAIEHLPKAGDAIGFVRLPTEEEWEFAARGGLAVSEAEFRAPRPPIPDGASQNEYIAHNGTDSAGGELALVGTLKPNPLGLHDLLGNAWEIVASPFALVRHGRLHGQTGGIVRRGGGVNWPLAEITSAQRFEMSPYNARRLEVQTDRYTGARFVISAISITSDAQNRELIAELDRMAQPDRSLPTAQSEEEVRLLLEQMQRDALTDIEKSRLSVVRDTLNAATAERNIQRDDALRMNLHASVLVCSSAVKGHMDGIVNVSLFLEIAQGWEQEALATGDGELLAEALATYDAIKAKERELNTRLGQEIREYASLLERMAASHRPETIRPLAAQIKDRHPDSNKRRSACYSLLLAHLETRFDNGMVDIPQIESNIRSIAEGLIQAGLSEEN
jgi:hypothetical protein